MYPAKQKKGQIPRYGAGPYPTRAPASERRPRQHVGAAAGRRAGETPTEAGPFRVKGFRASDLEERVYRMLLELDWTDDQIEFQVDVMGGRLPGGQVLDFVLWGFGLPQVVDVRGDYWHGSGKQVEDDRAKEAAVHQAWRRPFVYHSLYNADLKDDETAYTTLLARVGRGGGVRANV